MMWSEVLHHSLKCFELRNWMFEIILMVSMLCKAFDIISRTRKSNCHPWGGVRHAFLCFSLELTAKTIHKPIKSRLEIHYVCVCVHGINKLFHVNILRKCSIESLPPFLCLSLRVFVCGWMFGCFLFMCRLK